MKKIFLAFLCSSSLVACQTKYDGYILNGNIGGNSEGMKVQLVNEAVYPPVTIDSTVIKNGRFQLKGKVDRPGMYQLIIDKTGQDDPSQMLASRFYLENSVISYSGHVDSLRTYYWSDETFRKDPVVKGSASPGSVRPVFEKYRRSQKTIRNHK